MSAKLQIKTYLEGWRLGDPALSLGATAAGFYYDDPNTGRIMRDDFIGFMEDFKDAAKEICNGVLPEPFLTYTETVMQQQESVMTVWCWWCVTGTDFQGSAIIKVDDNGVLSERIAYFSPLPS